MSCSVKSCKNHKNLMKVGVSFHRIPRDQFRAYVQILGLHIDNFRVKYICSEHFQQTDFITTANQSRFLRKGVLPTLKMHLESENTPRNAHPAEKLTPSALNFPILRTSLKRTRHSSSSSTLTASSPEFGTVSFSPSPVEFMHTLSPQSPHDSESTSTASTPEISRFSPCSTDTRYDVPEFSAVTIKQEVLSDPEESHLSHTVEQKVQFIRTLHNYCANPMTLRKKYEESQAKLRLHSKQLYAARRTIQKLRLKIVSQKKVIDSLCVERNKKQANT